MRPQIERLIQAIEAHTGHKRESAGGEVKLWCPGHQGHSASLKITEAPNGRALIHCFAGCDATKVLSSMRWFWADLEEQSSAGGSVRPLPSTPVVAPGRHVPATLNLNIFCDERGLDRESLVERWKVKEGVHQNRPCLRSPTALGVDRIKFLDGTKPKYRWAATGGKAHWYGMEAAKRRGGLLLYLVNGEPSVWACDQEGVPAVCACGEGVTLTPAMIKDFKGSGFERFAVVFDRDAAGRAGALKALKAIRSAGLEAVALELPPELGEKADVDDLHRREGPDLAAALTALPHLPEPLPPGPVLRPFSEIEPEEVSWLWRPYIPAGKLVLFQGDPAAGKTWAALALCAMLIKQGRKAIYATLEDGLGDTLRPRADKLGIDPNLLIALAGKREEDGTERTLTLTDIHDIEQAIIQVKPALLVLDPISAWLQDANMNRANEVRGKLTPLMAFAEQYGVTVLILQHLTKAKTDRAIYRGQGSIDFVAACRSALLFGAAQGGQRAMVHLKNSLGPLGKSVGYTIGPEGFSWTGESELTAGDILEPEAGPEEKSEREDAKVWLEAALAEGPQDAGGLQQRFEKETGYSHRTLRRVLERMGGRSHKDTFSGSWKWALPEGDTGPHEGDIHTHTVPLGETTVPKGLHGKASTQGDTKKEPVPFGPGPVPYDERAFLEV